MERNDPAGAAAAKNIKNAICRSKEKIKTAQGQRGNCTSESF